MKATQLRALIASQPWLADEEWFHAFVNMVVSGAFNEAGALEKKDTQAFSGTVTSGVGIVPISGPIFSKPNFLTELLGIGTTYSTITKQVQDFVKNDKIDSILLDIDSPGGIVSGVNEASSIITKAGEQKPLYSYVGGVGASAAYWLMSGSKEIAVDATARVGSIGVVASFIDPKYDPEIEIVNSASPNKRPDITKDEGKKVIVEELDALADVFIGTVAENRGVSTKTVKSDFGKGGCLVGKKAVDAGMTDKVMFFSEFLEEIKSEESKEAARDDSSYEIHSHDSSTNDLNNSTEEDVFMDIKTLKEQHPEVYKAVVAEATAKKDEELATVTQERDSLKASLDKQKDDNSALTERVQSLEKNDALRAEKDMKAKADNMVYSALSASKVPARLHSKVANQIDHNKFVSEGKLDEEGFKAAIDAEVKDWEDITSETNAVQGMSFAKDQNVSSDDSAEDDAMVDRMVGYVN